jgi:hypothetical protein
VRRYAAPVVGGSAALAMIVVGCTSVTTGTASVDRSDAPVYRASVSASIEESAAESSTRESRRQASLTTKAVHTSCEGLSSSSVDAINAVNVFVDGVNNNAPDADAKKGPATDALNNSADLVETSLSDALSPQLHDALVAWIDAAHNLAQVISSDAGPDAFNDAVGKVNDTRETALKLCDASY